MKLQGSWMLGTHRLYCFVASIGVTPLVTFGEHATFSNKTCVLYLYQHTVDGVPPLKSHGAETFHTGMLCLQHVLCIMTSSYLTSSDLLAKFRACLPQLQVLEQGVCGGARAEMAVARGQDS